MSASMICDPAAHCDDLLLEWPIASGGNGHWYEVVDLNSGVDAGTAASVARSRLGALASLETAAELNFLRTVLNPVSMQNACWCSAARHPEREPQLLDATSNVLGWIRAARVDSMIDLVLIGDSNISFEGTGWDHGIAHALDASGIPCAAIGPTPFNDDGGTVGWRWSKFIGGAQQWPNSLGNYNNSRANAPPALAAMMNFPNGYPNTGTGYAWLSSGSATIGGGIFLQAGHPFITSGSAMEMRLRYGTLPGGGHFTPTAWRHGTMNRVIGTQVECHSEQFGSSESILAIPGNFAAGATLRLTIDDGSGVVAPFFLGWTSLERSNLSHGSCVSVLDWHGGATTDTVASDIESFTDETASLWVQTLRARQLRHNPNVRVLFLICSGMNDFGSTTALHESGLRRMISHLSTRWTVGGGIANEIGFVLMTSHDPSMDGPTERFLEFRAVGRAIAAERDDTAAIDLGAIPMEAAFYPGSSTGSPHLSLTGYERMSELIIAALDGSQGARCEWRWSTDVLVEDGLVDDSQLAPCRRAAAALVPSPKRGFDLHGLQSDDNVNLALIEYDSDCDGDGIVDRGAVAAGLVDDVNSNFVPDQCECLGDINLDSAVGSADLALLLNRWGEVDTGANLGGSGIIDAVDLTIMLAHWGDCSR